MKKTQSENKILFAAGIVTILVLGIVLYKNLNRQTQQPFQEQTQSTEKESETTIEPTPESKSGIEEDLFLEVGSPADGDIVSNPTLEVSGVTQAFAEVFVNDIELRADGQGNFSTTLILEEGENIIVITVIDDEGNFAEQELTVTFEAE